MLWSRAALLSIGILALGLMSQPPGPALAAPRASRILREHRAFQSAARHIQAQVILQRGPQEPFAPLEGARVALQRSLERLHNQPWSSARIQLQTPWPDIAPIPLLIERDQGLVLGDERLDAKELQKEEVAPELRLLSLGLALTRLDRGARRLKAPLEQQVLTLDRIDERYVWAIGDDKIAVWVDQEVYRPVRLEVGPDVLDSHHWTLSMRYCEEGPGGGWFPCELTIEQDREVTATLYVTQVELRKK